MLKPLLRLQLQILVQDLMEIAVEEVDLEEEWGKPS